MKTNEQKKGDIYYVSLDQLLMQMRKYTFLVKVK